MLKGFLADTPLQHCVEFEGSPWGESNQVAGSHLQERGMVCVCVGGGAAGGIREESDC